MQYTLRDLLLVLVLPASAMGVFGIWGIAVAAVLLVLVIAIVRKWAFPLFTLSLAFFLIFVAPTLIFMAPALLLVRPLNERERTGCSFNLQQIALALRHYQDRFKNLPPAYSKDAENKPIGSWRAFILPYMSRPGSFLPPYNPATPWNVPPNDWAMRTEQPDFICLSNKPEYPRALTNSVVVTGTPTLWPSSARGNLEDIPDGAENTILVMEMPRSDIMWAEPRDLTFEQVCCEIDSDPELKFFAAHAIDRGFFYLPDKAANVAFADGSVRCLSTRFLHKYLKAMLTRDGGEKVGFDDVPGPRLNWSRIIGLAILAFSAVGLLRRPKGDRLAQTAAD